MKLSKTEWAVLVAGAAITAWAAKDIIKNQNLNGAVDDVIEGNPFLF